MGVLSKPTYKVTLVEMLFYGRRVWKKIDGSDLLPF